jgi:hypothetical protein
MESYSSIKGTKVLIQATWMKFENILSEVSYKTIKWFHLHEGPRIVKFIEEKVEWVTSGRV